MSEFDVAERFSWATNRQTTEEEDWEYRLFGIFGIHLPLIYGEGKESALKRLKEIETSEDASMNNTEFTQPSSHIGHRATPPKSTLYQHEAVEPPTIVIITRFLGIVVNKCLQ
jgi:hypothetical protein